MALKELLVGGNQLSNFKGVQRCQVRVQGRAQVDAGGCLQAGQELGARLFVERLCHFLQSARFLGVGEWA